MSISRYLFGDFSTTFDSSLPISIAVGKLAEISDQSTFRRGSSQLHGYAARNEVVLWEGSDLVINPFRPYFHGSFSQEQDTVVLSGVFRADWRAKVWCTFVAIASPVAICIGPSGGLAGTLAVPVMATVALVLLRLSIRPGARAVRSLSSKIESAIASKKVNS